MDFWRMAYEQKWVDKDLLKKAVITIDNPYGDITIEEYKKITGEEFE